MDWFYKGIVHLYIYIYTVYGELVEPSVTIFIYFDCICPLLFSNYHISHAATTSHQCFKLLFKGSPRVQKHQDKSCYKSVRMCFRNMKKSVRVHVCSEATGERRKIQYVQNVCTSLRSGRTQNLPLRDVMGTLRDTLPL